MFSAMYLAMLRSRAYKAGQTMAIAVFKLLGTVAVSAAFVFFPPMFAGSWTLRVLALACRILDAIYVVALYRMQARRHADSAHAPTSLTAPAPVT